MKRILIGVLLGLLIGAAGVHASTVQNQNYTPISACVDLTTSVVSVDVLFVDADDGSPIGSNRYTAPPSGPLVDIRGRTLAASSPAAITTAANSLKAAVLAALASGATAGKVKP